MSKLSETTAARAGHTTSGVWVVVPAYNETKYLSQVLRKLKTYTTQIVVVDDGSRDDTAKVAAACGVVTLKHLVNLGKGAALKTGCDYAFDTLQAKAVILFDADDQHDPAQIPAFMKAFQTGAEVVFGVRDLTKMPALRAASNKIGSRLIWLLFGRYFADIPSGYKAFTRSAYSRLRWSSTGYSVEMEMAARTAKFHLSFAQVPIPTIYHDFDRGMTMLDVWQMIGLVLSWRLTL